MRSRLSIFSSRLFGSALLWSVLAICLIEGIARRTLPGQYASHEVDQLLFDLDQQRIPPHDTVFLGDSVGRQLAKSLLQRAPHSFVPLASNASIETPGQYYMLVRYLEQHPVPKRVILIMGNPVEGQLKGPYTENYVQRTFLHWQEIVELAWARRSLPFGLVMIGYKLSPVFRYRLSLQQLLSALETPDPYLGSFDLSKSESTDAPAAPHGLLHVMTDWVARHRQTPPIADVYFCRLGRLLEDLEVEWTYLPIPLPESASAQAATNGYYGHQMQRVEQLQAQFPTLHPDTRIPTYPDDWFRDGAHFRDEHLQTVGQDYADILTALGFGVDP